MRFLLTPWQQFTSFFTGRTPKPRRRSRPYGRERGRLGEQLEARCVLAPIAVISEVQAINNTTLADDDGAYSDWIELHNPGDEPLDLTGWYLTDDMQEPAKWQLPSLQIPPRGFAVVYASDKDRRDPAQTLHTNFRLGGDGESIALVRPDQQTVEHHFTFPTQVADLSYGTVTTVQQHALFVDESLRKVHVPRDGSLALDWTTVDFVDDDWRSGVGAIGFAGSGDDFDAVPVDISETMQGQNASAYVRIPFEIDEPADLLAEQLTLSLKYDDGFVAFLNGQQVLARNAPGGGDSPLAGLQAYYDFDTSLSDSAGTFTANSGIANNELQLHGAAARFVPGLRGEAIAMNVDGTDATRLTTMLQDDIDLGSQFTIEGWIYPTQLEGWGRLVMQWDGSGKNSIHFAVRNGSQLSLFHVDADGRQTNVDSSVGTVRPGAVAGWQHVAVVADGQHLRLYHNGVEVSAGARGDAAIPTPVPYAGTTKQLAANLGIGDAASSPRPSDAFHGYLDELALWSAALSPEQIASHFEAAESGYGLVPRDGSGQLQWDSRALASREIDEDGLEFEPFDLSDSRHLLRAGRNVLAIQALNASADDDDLLIDARLHTGTLVQQPDQIGYLQQPTPAAPNAQRLAGLLSDVRFSVPRGYFNAPFELQIATETPGSTIRYTLDGTLPDQQNGFVYDGPLTIASTSTVRAAGFRDGYQPTDVVTQTYLFVDQVLEQPNTAPANAHWDTQMDPDVVQDTDQTHSVQAGLVALPTLSIVMDGADLFGNQGIYQNPERRGDDWIRPGSIEYFYPDEYEGHRVEEGFAVTAGVRISGIFSRLTSNPKHSFRLSFRNEFGPGKLEFPLFPDSPVTSFDNLVVLNGHNQSWATGIANTLYLRDQVSRDLQELNAGDLHVNGVFVNLYLNGMYWGQYNLIERPDDSFAEQYLGGDKDNYDVLKGVRFGETPEARLIKGTRDAWETMFEIANRDMSDPVNYQAIQQYVDLDQLIDYNIGIIYTGDRDGPTGIVAGQSTPKNFYALRERTPEGRFRFFPWDAEFTFEQLSTDVSDRLGSENPARLHMRLRANPEYRLRFADHVKQHFFHDGRLTPEQVSEQFLQRAREIDQSIVAESARWGDSKRSRPFTRDASWIPELNRVLERIIPRRTEVVLNQFRADRLYPDVVAPEFAMNEALQHGGLATLNDLIHIHAPAGTIYYTTDGTDPRLGDSASPPSNDPAPTARVYDGPVTLVRTMNFKARALFDGHWSALSNAVFTVSLEGLKITELMYHPADAEPAGAFDDQDFEFIEISNLGSRTVPLNDLEFDDGILFDFQQSSITALSPGASVVVTSNLAAFQARYGTGLRVAGQYSGRLSNSGERVVLRERWGQLIESIAYSHDWYSQTDGEGYSLTRVTPFGQLEPTDVAAWRPSRDAGGSPAAIDQDHRPGSIVINEVVTQATDGSESWIELRNTTTGPIDVGGWYLSESQVNRRQYRIADGTVIPAFGHYLLTEAANYGGSSADAGRLISFSLRSGERRTLYLSSADNRGNLLGYRDSVELMALSPNQAQGRAAQSLGNDSFTRLEQPTPGSHNTTSAVGPLVIHEVMYNPSFVYPEFIELRNISSQRITLGDSAANHWRIRGGIDFDFPATSAIEANGFSLLVQGRAGQDEGSEASRFRQQFSIAANVPIFVYFAAAHGSLNNAGETVRLEQSWTLPGANTLRHSLVDEVRYENQAPWPLLADGRGASLSRFDATAVGMDAENWLASRDLGTPGAENLFYQYHVRGDFDGDRRRTARDIDLLSFQIRSQRIDPAFDLNGDQFLTEADRDELVSQILGTFAGDTNLDGRFDSRDIVLVMQAGHYDNLLVGPAGWSQGDWNGDGVFNSSDLVHAFQVGRYV